MLGILFRGPQEPALHTVDVAPRLRDRRKVVVGQAGGRPPERERRVNVLLGFVQLACMIQGSGQVH
jgi:hypothetical protein